MTLSGEDAPFDVKRLRMEQRIAILCKLILKEGEVDSRKAMVEFHTKIEGQPETVKYLAVLQARGLVKLCGESAIASCNLSDNESTHSVKFPGELTL